MNFKDRSEELLLKLSGTTTTKEKPLPSAAISSSSEEKEKLPKEWQTLKDFVRATVNALQLQMAPKKHNIIEDDVFYQYWHREFKTENTFHHEHKDVKLPINKYYHVPLAGRMDVAIKAAYESIIELEGPVSEERMSSFWTHQDLTGRFQELIILKLGDIRDLSGYRGITSYVIKHKEKREKTLLSELNDLQPFWVTVNGLVRVTEGDSQGPVVWRYPPREE